MSGSVRFGTCSWKFDSWKGLIYSDHADENYLAEYADTYPTVEIDQWFWSLFGEDKVSLPRPDTVSEYLAAVPADFRFTIKVPNSVTLTHFYKKAGFKPLTPNPYFFSPNLFQDFLERIAPMQDQVDALMFQFEYLNKKKMSSLDKFLDRFETFLAGVPPDWPYAVELRNPNYLNEPYFRFLKDRGISHVFLQGYYMPSIVEVYDKYAEFVVDRSIIRLHGYEREGIEQKTGKRWDAVVTPMDHELSRIADMIDDMVKRGVDVIVNVNNHYEGSAPRTIEKLERLLGRSTTDETVADSHS
jgi:uncharacterized protein YecE (DUF72 family)